ncbi:MAG: amidohydrolase family protein [Acidimicrobiales bacterium]
MTTTIIPEPDINNEWRLSTPGCDNWTRSARPDSADKFLMISADGHVQEPSNFLVARLPEKYHHRVPTIAIDAKGDQFQKTEGFRPAKLNWVEPLEGHEQLRNRAGRVPADRAAELALDGCDAEVLFPNKGLTIWATTDAEFSQAMCRAYNEWVWDEFSNFNDQLAPMATIAPASMQLAIEEVQRCAELGFKGLALPCKPVFGPPNVDELNYNLKEFAPFWSCVEEVGLPVTFHVGTGRDPRAARGSGGALINYTVHGLSPGIEPLVNLCASGVAERHPGLQFGVIEGGIGWVPWTLQAMDEAYLKHHMWARPKLELMPSDYFRRQGFATFQDDKVGLDLAREHNLVPNFLWANDFPHHEGSWPYSAQAIERTMAQLDDDERAQILGLNAARIFGFSVPERYLNHGDAAEVAQATAIR